MKLEEFCRKAIEYIKECRGKSKEEIVSYLKSIEDKSLSNLVYLYYFPRNLLDRELPSRVKREDNINHLVHLVEACKTPQYKRFMMHLFHSFLDPAKVHPVTLEAPEESPLFGDTIRGESVLVGGEYQWDAWGSNDSGIVLSIREYIYLIAAANIIREAEPSFLNNWPNSSKDNYFN